MSNSTKVAKAHGLLSDAMGTICGLMNAFQYDGMTPDVAGPWFAKAKMQLDAAASAYGIGVSKNMTPEEFSVHMATEYAKAKLEPAVIGKARIAKLQEAIEVAKVGFVESTSVVSIPLFDAPTKKNEAALAVTEPGVPAVVPQTVAAPVVEPVTEPVTQTPAVTEPSTGAPSMDDVTKRIEALSGVSNKVTKAAQDTATADEIMESVSWPQDMASGMSMKGEDPRKEIKKADIYFGADLGFEEAAQ